MYCDIKIFKLINGMANKNIFADDIMIVFSKYVSLFFICSLAILYFYGVFKRKEDIRTISIDTTALTVINLAISFIIGMIYFVPRPFMTGNVNLLFPHIADASFPSDHAIGTMSIAIGINKYKRIYGIFFFIISVIVGVSRIYVGHHYPSDVLGGYLLVLITNYLYSKLVKDNVRKFYIKTEDIVLKYASKINVL